MSAPGGLLQPRPPACLVARGRKELDAGGAAAGGKLEAFAVEADRPPDLPPRGLVAGEPRDGVVAEPVDPVDEPRLRLGERRLALARGENVAGRERVGAAEAAIEMDALDREPEDREIAEVRIELRLGVALQIRVRARASVARSIRPFSVMRGWFNGSPRSGSSASSTEARGSKARCLVWRASVDIRKSGAPSKSLATPTRVVSGAPVVGSSVASAAVREIRIRRLASATARAWAA